MKSFIFVSQILLILLSSINVAFAQPAPSSIILDNIQINNQETLINDDNNIYGKEGDAIRIAGKLLSGEKVIVFVGDKEYVATIDENNNWFVLFSITNYKEEQYPIEAQLIENGNKGEKILLTTLVLSDTANSDESIENTNIEKKDSDFGFKDIVIIILTLSLAYTVLNYFILKSQAKRIYRKKN